MKNRATESRALIRRASKPRGTSMSRLLVLLLTYASPAVVAQATYQSQKPAEDRHVISIRSLSSAFCSGYCLFEMTVARERARLTVRSTKHRWWRSPDRSVERKTSRHEWANLVESLEQSPFMVLPPSTECPGCIHDMTDTIIVAFSNGTTKSVSYYDGRSPEAIGSLCQALESISDGLYKELAQKYPEIARERD